ncbi:hypothetical protein PF004_g17555 [Phytophthora fragariae]|uniref:RxLR effector protein n=1 Tax=Phytophthora fragariae TaxID=53985 RepID=A0A6G0NF43_9STRA|nr:hypothetical protein PF004_g17555 [Phytophthora fragariae]
MKLCISCACFAAAVPVSARGILYTVCHNTTRSRAGHINSSKAKSRPLEVFYRNSVINTALSMINSSV